MRIAIAAPVFAAFLRATVAVQPAAAAGAAVTPDPLPPSADEARPSAPLIIDARIDGDQKRTSLIVDLTASIDVAVFTLADPYRVVVDLPEVRFGLPDDAGSEGAGLISAFRYGRISRGESRIVHDASGPVAIDKPVGLRDAGQRQSYAAPNFQRDRL